MRIKRSMRMTKFSKGPTQPTQPELLPSRQSAILAPHQMPLSQKFFFNRSIANGAHGGVDGPYPSISLFFQSQHSVPFTDGVYIRGAEGWCSMEEASRRAGCRLGFEFPAHIPEWLDL